MEKIIIYGTEKRAAMYFGYLCDNYDVVGFVSTNGASGSIYGVPVYALEDLFEGEHKADFFDRIVMVVETDQIIQSREKISSAAEAISIDDLIEEEKRNRDGNGRALISPYVEYINREQIKIIKEILAASDAEVADHDWMLDKVIRYGCFCFESDSWFKKDKKYNWVVYGLQQVPEEFASFCNFLSEIEVSTAAEVGVYRGRSAFFICAVLARKNPDLVYNMIDIFDRIDDFELFKEVLPQLNKCIPSSSDDHAGEKYDFVFIDADHSYDASINDFNKLGQYTSKITAFHDIYAHEYDHENGGTVRMWQEVLDRTTGCDHKVFAIYPDKWMGIGCVIHR